MAEINRIANTPYPLAEREQQIADALPANSGFELKAPEEHALGVERRE
jgi:hypothetical protein